MENLIKIFYDWEIQVLVFLSFTIQIFLFFTGGLQRRSTSLFLRLFVWMAYLGADLVAVYALGYLSRHADATTGRDSLRGTHPLAFFWAPFLLIHLGGQDTITAFAIEDNNLWLRHLLNLVVQVVLALYVFWRSIGRHSLELLVSGFFLFVVGIIKYGERIWSLKCGSFESLESSKGNHYNHKCPEVNDTDVGYSNTVCIALKSMQDVHKVFAFRTLRFLRHVEPTELSSKQSAKVLEVELGIISDDLYTKAHVLRTRSGIVLRSITQISSVVSFMLFLAGNKSYYGRADIAITYSLFIGIFFLEACASLIFIMSPWSWAWLTARKHEKLARFSWFLFSNRLIGMPEKRSLWSNTVGQHNLMKSPMGSGEPIRSCNQQLITMITKLMTLIGVEKDNIFWVNNLLAMDYVKADELLDCLLEGVNNFRTEDKELQFPNIDPALSRAKFVRILDFGHVIVFMHMATEIHLGKYSPLDKEDFSLVKICRQLSRYMIYLLVHHPSLLPLNVSAVDTLSLCESDEVREWVNDVLGGDSPLPTSKESLEEAKQLWIRIFIYAAAKSRPEVHAELLGKGWELLTFVWLLLAHYKIGDRGNRRVELVNQGSREPMSYALLLPEENSQPGPGAHSSSGTMSNTIDTSRSRQ